MNKGAICICTVRRRVGGSDGCYSLSADVDECSAAVLIDSDICNNTFTRRICSNTVGGFDCVCPTGLELTGGICIRGKLSIRYRLNTIIDVCTCIISSFQIHI